MPIGNMLGVNEQQYVALKDESSGLWRVLDTWHDDLKNLTADDDIPDNSDAVTTLSEGQFIALIKEAGRLGVLANATFGTGEAELENTILEKDQEIIDLRDELMKLKEDTSKVIQDNTHSEEYILKNKAIVAGHDLKEKAMDNILKLVSIQDMSNLSKE
jgi:hypothetical protein